MNGTIYSLEDHPNLSLNPTRELFETFRREVLALDPCVMEQISKHYVVYKAERIFVKVKPQKAGLRVHLDGKTLADVDLNEIEEELPSLRRWADDRAIVGLRKAEKLLRVLGLVRQALEAQLAELGEE